jgi:hypothetical protein
MFAEHNGHELA